MNPIKNDSQLAIVNVEIKVVKIRILRKIMKGR